MPKKKENKKPSANEPPKGQEPKVVAAGGSVENRAITDELRESYLDYAMSVIVSRALPDVRDGLKPVQRRILWSAWESGLNHTAKFRKSANIVGGVMAHYHPHGDASIYDAMAHMAQDFSLRYPLVHGQGNWGCFTKDTKVKLTDGRNLSFGELVEEYRQGKKNYTYAVNSAGSICMAEIENPRITKKDAELVRVFLDNGEEIRCTPNHRFMLKDGSYREARDLKNGESLMPLYEKLSTSQDRLNREGYVLVYQPKNDEWVPAHHLADNYNLTAKTYPKSAGRVRHHIDFNKLNNNPDNIKRIDWGAHWKTHYEHTHLQHQDPEYVRKIAEGRENFWANPENRKKNSERLAERNRLYWKNPIYREHMRRTMSEATKAYFQENPEARVEISEQATKTLKKLWKDPFYRNLFHEKIVAANKKRSTNNTGKVKFLNVCRIVLERYHTLNESFYERVRTTVYQYGSATRWSTGIKKYFNGDPNLVFHEINKNHKVVKIEPVNEREDVYDLTIDRHHNFSLAAGIFVHNSVDGDAPAAQRYTEAKLAKITSELLTDIEKETVDWGPNYDNTRKEPHYLPAKVPNLLLNGTVGIAVGMATSIPPHNLTELVDGITYLIEHPDATTKELMQFVPGPDFPTGGVIYDRKAIEEAYSTGKGAITMRAVAQIEERKSGSFQIVITEIPYQVNKATLLEKIADLVQTKKIEGIRDLRDESDREGLRVVVELKSDATPQKILNQLFQYTELQKNFYCNVLALVDGIQPQILSLKDVLAAYLEHRKIIVRRRTEFDLKKAKERAHILEGLVSALGVIDKIIQAIKGSKDKEDAAKNLVKHFKLTEIQANAILEMRLQTLAALERQKLEDELAEKKKLIKELEFILAHPKKILEIIEGELAALKKDFPEPRRTKIVASSLTEFREEDLIPNEEAIVMFTRDGYVKRLPPATFRAQKRGGKGLIGFELKEEDMIDQFLSLSTHDNVLFFTDHGKVFQTKAHEIPVASRTAKGKSIYNYLEIQPTERVSAIIGYSGNEKDATGRRLAEGALATQAGRRLAEGALAPQAGNFLVMATRGGVIKKTPLKDFGNVRRTGIIALKLGKGDLLRWVKVSSGKDEIILSTAMGQAIRFKEKDIRAMSRAAAGVRAIHLKKGDNVAGLDIIEGDARALKLLSVMANGFGKQTPLKEYKVQRRGGSGVKTAKVTEKTGAVIATHVVDESVAEVLAFSKKGQALRTKIENIREASRATQGVRIMNLEKGDELIGIVCL